MIFPVFQQPFPGVSLHTCPLNTEKALGNMVNVQLQVLAAGLQVMEVCVSWKLRGFDLQCEVPSTHACDDLTKWYLLNIITKLNI